MDELSRALKADVWRKSIKLKFTWCDSLTDGMLSFLAASIPQISLETLSIGARACKQITDVSVANLAHHLPDNLTDLKLSGARPGTDMMDPKRQGDRITILHYLEARAVSDC